METKTLAKLIAGNLILVSCADSVNSTDHPAPPEPDPVPGKTRPNILLFVTDDQPYDTMKCWGGQVYTPNIDRLAEGGMKFERMYAAAPISAAVRYSILSGRYSSQCTGPQFMKRSPEGKTAYIDNVVMELEKDRNNLPRALQQLGYKTGMVGKWHLGHHFSGNDLVRQKEWQECGLEYYTKESDPGNPAVASALEHNHDWYTSEIRQTGFDYAGNVYWGNLKEVYNDRLNYHNIDWTVQGALDFIESCKGNPFFLYFSTTLHHGPEPKKSVDSRYADVTGKGYSPKKINVLPERNTIYTRLQEQGISPDQAPSLWLDDALGRLMSELEKKGIADNTVIIFLSDHSISLKSSLYEGGIRTPMMVWWPGHVPAGSICNSLANTCDLAPTIVDIAGGQPADEAFMGTSLRTVLSNPQAKVHESIFAEIGNARAVITDNCKYIAVDWSPEIQAKIDRGLTTDEYNKIGYIVNSGLTILGKKNKNYFDRDQLFNLQTDPMETTNLFGKDASKDLEMKRMMTEHLERLGDRTFREFVVGK